MSSEMLEWVYQCLKRDEDIIVPLKKLWNRRYGTTGMPSFEQFAKAVLRDDRFEQLYCLDHDLLLEAVDCFSGPRVKLRSRAITEECIVRLIQKHNDRTLEALRRALKLLGEDSDRSSEQQIQEAILMLEQLRPVFRPWVHLKPKDQTNVDG